MREGSARALWGEEPRAFDQERRAGADEKADFAPSPNPLLGPGDEVG